MDSGDNKQTDVNRVIFNLTKELREKYPRDIGSYDLCERQKTILEKIERVIYQLVTDVFEEKSDISIKVNRKSWNNCVFEHVLQRLPSEDCCKTNIKLEIRNIRKFASICFLLGHIYRLLKIKKTCTKRELFYRNIEVFSSQDAINSALTDISSLLDASLYELNIHTTSKGLIFGPVLLQTKTQKIDCSAPGGSLIPADVADMVDIQSCATFILLIEKDTIFQRLLDHNAINSLPTCIFITGKGFPDINTRTLLKRLWDFLGIPILALVDADPWGIEIMCVYRFGSLTMAHSSDQLAVPSIRWLGVFPSEVTQLSSACVPLDDGDRKLLSDFLKRPYTGALPRLKQELQSASAKAEIENIDDPQGYLAHKYLPNKIVENDFI